MKIQWKRDLLLATIFASYLGGAGLIIFKPWDTRKYWEKRAEEIVDDWLEEAKTSGGKPIKAVKSWRMMQAKNTSDGPSWGPKGAAVMVRVLIEHSGGKNSEYEFLVMGIQKNESDKGVVVNIKER